MSAELKTLFRKPVDRAIEGVIKADDDSGLRNEVEEYVITAEVMKRLETFLDSYNEYETANGVWISGFFGSGKSHLLKMLSMLLEQREIEGCDIVEEFMEKLEDNEFMKGALRKAVSIPSKSILFNIDQKSDVISKDQTDALIAVFVKVFDESCGYYGKQPYIAQFERQLDRDGLLADFKTVFEELQGKSWAWGCERINRVSAAIDQAYEKVTGAKVSGVIDKFRSDYKLSIEDFANQVNDYIKTQPHKKFRLNFYVDEVGQYIADNTKLMTNLQTVAESLNTKCKGRAWVIVTAQKDMNSVVGEMEKDQANDFSKIMGRFANRMNLASQDVAEVIQERLLKKKEEKRSLVGTIYDEQTNNFKTLFEFTDDSRTYKNYRDKDHFIDCYPFVPYQFDLFQACIQNLSLQNAFEGKHQSVGERSMLGVFQDVAKQIADHELGELATFDLMFEGIRATLKGQIQSAVNTAEKNLDNKLAVRLLKALFLVKYVREFKATVRNLSVLMLNGFDINVSERQKEIDQALSLLETETYIQRSGETYEFLTDEEKDIEQEIKNTEVDAQEASKDLCDIIFDGVLRSKKIRDEDTKRDFSFTRKLDDRVIGREHDLAVHVISPDSESAGQYDRHKMETMGDSELRIVMDADDRLIRELMMYKKTAKYVAQNISVIQKDSQKRILSEKSSTNAARKEEVKELCRQLLSKAKLFVNGQEVECGSEDPATRLSTGFKRLIDTVYTNLRMLQGVVYTEGMIADILSPARESLLREDTAPLTEAELEVQSVIQREYNKGVRTTMKSLCETLEGGSYGWPLPAVQCLVARLGVRGKTEIKVDSNVLQGKDLAAALKNTKSFGNMILEPQVEFTPGQMSRLKEFYSDFFDAPPAANDATALAKEVADKLGKVSIELGELIREQGKFPFLGQLRDLVDQTKGLSAKGPKFFLLDFDDARDELLDAKDNTLDPVRTFMKGSQADIYREAADFVGQHANNLRHIDAAAADELKGVLDDPNVYRGRKVQDLKARLDDLKQQVDAKVQEERSAAKHEIEELKQQYTALPGYSDLDVTTQNGLTQEFDRLADRLGEESLISEIRETKRTFETDTYTGLLTELDKKGDDDDGPDPSPVVYVNTSDLSVKFDRPYVASDEDVNAYVESLKAALLEQVKAGKRVRV
jgi:energy-coupling factor transporter ATP-binding protein EcfA2